MNYILSALFVSVLLVSCSGTENTDNSSKPAPVETNLWLVYSNEATVFKIWSPKAQEVKVLLYQSGNGGEPLETLTMKKNNMGVWELKKAGDLHGTYYTYSVKFNEAWLAETPGIYAQAVGVNGKRAMVLNFETTNPKAWETDKGPEVKCANEAIIYELHIRDMTIHPESGSTYPGKYLGLAETGTKGPGGVATGIDHLKELGVTHVHLLPTFDHYYLDETMLDSAQFNWGYDPHNYNVPDGSYSTDPYKAAVRIGEFKQMVKAFHDNGIGVIMDVVYNHTGRGDDSQFSLEYPGYYYRHNDDGTYANASGCGNETASERAMMRKYIAESLVYWTNEYHIDAFRFDLMAIHDIETMNHVAETLKKVNPSAFIYGEGWTAGDSPLPVEKRALKQFTYLMPQISAFSDDIRDGLKGSVFGDQSTGFVSGAKNTEESVKFGVVGSIKHPQIDYDLISNCNAPWANEPWQSVSYVSCHDNHTLFDKLNVSRPDATPQQIIAMDKLANAVVLTSQGVAFLHAGSEMLRTKFGEHNSYNLPDSVNRMDWSRKTKYARVVVYYTQLIAFRKAHPALRMTSAKEVNKNLEFLQTQDGLVSYVISNNANGDQWKRILVVYNANTEIADLAIEGDWKVAVLGDDFFTENYPEVSGTAKISALSMFVAFQE